jgi:signal transduction histidine kinase
MQRLRHSIQLRLLVSFTLVTAVGGLVLFLIARRQLEETSVQLYQLNLQSEALTISNSLLNALNENEDGVSFNNGVVSDLLRQLRTNQNRDLTLFTPQLQVIGYTGAAPSVEAASFPEIIAAQNGKISYAVRPDETGRLFAYAAAPIAHEQENIQALLQIKAPLQPAYDVAQAESIRLASVWLPVVMIVAIVSLWIGEGIARPIRQLHVSALRIANGALDEAIIVKSSDEIGQLGQAFNYMVARLNQLLTTQRNFVSNAAHELRAPLMSLSLRMEALQENTLAPDQRQLYLRESADELKYMSEMVTSLLTLARLDEGKYRVAVEPFDIAALLNDVARNWRIQAQRSGLAWLASVPDSLPVPRINASDLRMVLDNLLSNAVKYTLRGGEIQFQASCELNKLCLVVTDTGLGFDPDEGAHLFERFYRTAQTRARSIMGTGLGLAIVRLLLEQYDASVNASSAGNGQGATFVVLIPLA